MLDVLSENMSNYCISASSITCPLLLQLSVLTPGGKRATICWAEEEVEGNGKEEESPVDEVAGENELEAISTVCEEEVPALFQAVCFQARAAC